MVSAETIGGLHKQKAMLAQTMASVRVTGAEFIGSFSLLKILWLERQSVVDGAGKF
jgi:hypothetical protein